MKTIIFGDTHGRTAWKSVIEQEQPDKVIFLGDYVSTHDDISPTQQIENLKDILRYKKSNEDNVILLRGNHDYQHLGFYWARCSGHDPYVLKYMSDIKDLFLSLTQNVYIENNVIYSHAGVSSEWMEQVAKIKYPELINDLEVDEKFGFWPCKMSDYYGTSPTQPPTWIRPQTLEEYAIKDYTQVVGHTPVHNITKIVSESGTGIWLCDCMPKQYLLNIDEEFLVKDINN